MNTKLLSIILLIIALLTTSCGNKTEKEFNSMLMSLASKDKTIDGSDWQQIVEFLDANKASMKEFYTDGKLNTEAVQKHVIDYFQGKRNPIDIQFVGVVFLPCAIHF